VKKANLIKTLLKYLCSFFIALTPIILQEVNCILLWGEPECPDELKKLYSNK